MRRNRAPVAKGQAHASKELAEIMASDPRPPKKRRFIGLLKKGGPGRPQMLITKAGLEAIERMARAGHSDVSIAKALGTCKRGLQNLKLHNPTVQDALDAGRAGLEDELSDILLEVARNREHKMQTIAAMYLTKARCGWRDQGEAGPEQRPNVIIQLPDSQSPADYMARLRVQHVPPKGELPE